MSYCYYGNLLRHENDNNVFTNVVNGFRRVVETSVTYNSSFQSYPYRDDHTIQTPDTQATGLKPFTKF